MNLHEDRIRLLISKSIRRSTKSWATVADELSTAVGKLISESMLHEYTRARRVRESDSNSNGTKKLFPAEWLFALAQITGSHEIEQFALCDDCRRALAVGKLGMEKMARKR